MKMSLFCVTSDGACGLVSDPTDLLPKLTPSVEDITLSWSLPVALPGYIETPIQFRKGRAVRTGVAQRGLVREAGWSGIDIHAGDIEIVVAITLPGDHQIPVERAERGGLGAGFTRNKLPSKRAPVVERYLDIQVIVAVSSPGKIKIATDRGKRRAQGAGIAEDNLARKAGRVARAVQVDDGDVQLVVAVAFPPNKQ